MSEYRVRSETGQLREVLVCPPEHYRWLPLNVVARRSLAQLGSPDPVALAAQHDELVQALRQGGATVHVLPPEPHLHMMAYTRDPVVVTPWGPLLCQMERLPRRGEPVSHLHWHAAAGSRFWRHANAGTIEGGDVHIIRPGLALIGWSGGRTDEAGARQLAGWLRAEGWEVRLEPFDEHFLHIDLLFCMAAPGLAVVCSDVLPAEFLGWLRDKGIRWLDVPYRDAMRLGTNILSLGGGRVVSARASRALNAALRAEGLDVLDPELSLLTAGGGGPHCLTCPLLRDD